MSWTWDDLIKSVKNYDYKTILLNLKEFLKLEGKMEGWAGDKFTLLHVACHYKRTAIAYLALSQVGRKCAGVSCMDEAIKQKWLPIIYLLAPYEGRRTSIKRNIVKELPNFASTDKLFPDIMTYCLSFAQKVEHFEGTHNGLYDLSEENKVIYGKKVTCPKCNNSVLENSIGITHNYFCKLCNKMCCDEVTIGDSKFGMKHYGSNCISPCKQTMEDGYVLVTHIPECETCKTKFYTTSILENMKNMDTLIEEKKDCRVEISSYCKIFNLKELNNPGFTTPVVVPPIRTVNISSNQRQATPLLGEKNLESYYKEKQVIESYERYDIKFDRTYKESRETQKMTLAAEYAAKGDPFCQFLLSRYYEFKKLTGLSETLSLKFLKYASGYNIPEALNDLGYYYSQKEHLNEKEALSCFKKAADMGCLTAMSNYAYFLCEYNKNNLTEAMKREAIEYYKTAADKGNLGAMCSLGFEYDCNPKKILGVNKEKALYYYKKAAEGGHKLAQKNLGLCYKNGDGTPVNIVLAEKWLSMSEKNDDSDESRVMCSCGDYIRKYDIESHKQVSIFHHIFQCSCGMKIEYCNMFCHRDSIAHSENRTNMSKMLERKALADAGDPFSQYLTSRYIYFKRIDGTEQEMVSYLKRAVEGGDISAMCDYGYMLSSGDDERPSMITRDDEEGLKLYEKVSNLDDDNYVAKTNLCYLVSNSKRSSSEVKKYIEKYLRPAAKMGYALAECNLGYEEETNRNYSESIKLYRAAAEKGHKLAQRNLAFCYYYGGYGVEKDLIEAEKWFRISDSNVSGADDNRKLCECGDLITTNDYPLHIKYNINHKKTVCKCGKTIYNYMKAAHIKSSEHVIQVKCYCGELVLEGNLTSHQAQHPKYICRCGKSIDSFFKNSHETKDSEHIKRKCLCGEYYENYQEQNHLATSPKHKLITCDCSQQIESYKMADHLKNSTTHKIITCDCGESVESYNLENHKNESDKHEKCPGCMQIIVKAGKHYSSCKLVKKCKCDMYVSKEDFKTHLKNEDHTKTKCPKCTAIMCKCSLLKHIHDVHRIIKCYCGIQYEKKDELEHKLTIPAHSIVECPDCKKTMEEYEYENKHKKLHEEPVQTPPVTQNNNNMTQFPSSPEYVSNPPLINQQYTYGFNEPEIITAPIVSQIDDEVELKRKEQYSY